MRSRKNSEVSITITEMIGTSEFVFERFEAKPNRFLQKTKYIFRNCFSVNCLF